MKVSDYIVEYLIKKEITDVFGYPGGMVTHLMDSFRKYKDQISAHVVYHEQAAAFAACGYAQTSGKPGVAYVTSGPGATNLITGICNAWFDSIPAVFITGQVNTTESKGQYGVRQRGFQETDIISMVKDVTKYAAYVGEAENIRYELDKAFAMALEGRQGPVVLDIPMNIFRAEMDENELYGWEKKTERPIGKSDLTIIAEKLEQAKRPCLLLGNGIRRSGCIELCRELCRKSGIPVVTSMIAGDLLPDTPEYREIHFGFLGAYGDRCANFVLAKSDFILALGARLDVRQVGGKRENFAKDAVIVRVEIDPGELSYRVREDEVQIPVDVKVVMQGLLGLAIRREDYASWRKVCADIRDALEGKDDRLPNQIIDRISRLVPDHRTVTTDVGQNQVWVAQSFCIKDHQNVLFSGGHGAMGYSLPAAIGAFYGNRRPVVCFAGDGGIQMNIQEFQFLARERLPVKVVILNNQALGMIRHFQEMYFEDRYVQTVPEGGYTVPDFCAVAAAYGLKSRKVTALGELDMIDFQDGEPEVIEIIIPEKTYVFPKLEFGKPNQDQEPLIDRGLYRRLMDL